MKRVHYRAAGGIVLDLSGRVLLIERDVVRAGKPLHEVRLPKGKIKNGETDERAAVREVCEETGYCHVEITADLGTATCEFVRERKGKQQQVTREEHYYLMRLTEETYTGQDMKPGSEEALFKPLWIDDLATAETLLTYEGEQEFVRRGIEHRE